MMSGALNRKHLNMPNLSVNQILSGLYKLNRKKVWARFPNYWPFGWRNQPVIGGLPHRRKVNVHGFGKIANGCYNHTLTKTQCISPDQWLLFGTNILFNDWWVYSINPCCRHKVSLGRQRGSSHCVTWMDHCAMWKVSWCKIGQNRCVSVPMTIIWPLCPIMVLMCTNGPYGINSLSLRDAYVRQ